MNSALSYTNAQYRFIFQYPSDAKVYDQGTDGIAASLSLVVTNDPKGLGADDPVTVRIYSKEGWPPDKWSDFEDAYVKQMNNGKVMAQIYCNEKCDVALRAAVMSSFRFLPSDN